MFSLFAPTIDEVQLIFDGKEYEMIRHSDGRFESTPSNLTDGEHSYKFRIKKQGWVLSSTIDVLDPYVKRYDPDQQLGYVTIKNGQIYEEKFQWQYDDVKLPDNDELILYELFVADFADNGQFSGVIEKLDYLERLGINGIELMPIAGSEGKDHDWGYLPRHFFSLKSTYGSAHDLKCLVDQCHKRKIRVLVDCVFNHSDEQCPLALIDKDYWYYKGRHHPGDPYYWGPEFNYEYEDEKLKVKPAVKFIRDVVRYWFSEFHFDGIRFDAAKQMDNYDILRELDSIARSIRSTYPIFTQAEYVPETKDICKAERGPVDACWSSSFHEGLRGTLAWQKDKLEKFGNFDRLKYSFSTKIFVNYLSCHDNERLLYDIGKEDEDGLIRMKTATILLFTSAGTPMIRQGTELGDSRELGKGQIQKKSFPMPWSLLDKEWNRRLFETFRQLIHLRHSNSNLRNGPIEFFYENENERVLAFSRGTKLVVIVNFHPQAKAKYLIGPFPEKGLWIDYLTHEEVNVDQSGNLTLDLLPFDSRLYIKHS